MEKYGDPEIETRIERCEVTYWFKTSVSDLAESRYEPESTWELSSEQQTAKNLFRQLPYGSSPD